MIDSKVISDMFWERNSIDIAPFINCVVRLHCFPVSNHNIEETFVGSIKFDQNFPMLDVGFPWREGDKMSMAQESAVSPNIDDPKAYYILKSIEALPNDIIEQWFKAGKKFIESVEKEKKK